MTALDFWLLATFPCILLLVGYAVCGVWLGLGDYCERRALRIEAEIQGHLDMALSCALDGQEASRAMRPLYQSWHNWERARANSKRARASAWWSAANFFSVY